MEYANAWALWTHFILSKYILISILAVIAPDCLSDGEAFVAFSNVEIEVSPLIYAWRRISKFREENQVTFAVSQRVRANALNIPEYGDNQASNSIAIGFRLFGFRRF